jgi:hypothetical protein
LRVLDSTDVTRSCLAQSAVLDADDGTGWALAEALLRPRKVEVSDDGGVRFVEETGARRLPIVGALKHPFLQQVRSIYGVIILGGCPRIVTVELKVHTSLESPGQKWLGEVG